MPAKSASGKVSGLKQTSLSDGLLDDGDLEKLHLLILELRELTSSGVPVIVEGLKDMRALEKMGIKGEFYKISGHGSILNFIERFSGIKEILVLTDFDRAGEELAEFCEKHLRGIGVKPQTELRKKLKRLLHKEVKDVSGIERIVRKYGLSL